MVKQKYSPNPKININKKEFKNMKLPSQLEAETMLRQLEQLEINGEILPENNIDCSQISNEESYLPNSCSTWLLSQLKSPFNIKTPDFFPFPCNSKEMFSWVERNNQLSEEKLRSLLFEEGRLEEIKTCLQEYAEDIPTPKESKLLTKTPVDPELIVDEDIKTYQAPNCFLWQWGKFTVFVGPPEFDILKVDDFYGELETKGIRPDAFLLMPYDQTPLTGTDSSMGGELWHSFPPDYPLFWEETKVYLETLRCQYEFEKNLKKKFNKDIQNQIDN
jgi:hypothetical protein